MKIGLIGSGNVAWNLAKAFSGMGMDLAQVHSRERARAAAFAAEFQIPDFSDAPADLRQDLDLVIICASDHAVAEIAQAYAPFRGAETVFAHTAGSIPLSALEPLGNLSGVFYPLQSFTRTVQADFSRIPLFLEGSDIVLARLRPLAMALTEHVFEIDSVQRLRIHLGAVFASNFANFMWILAEDCLKDHTTFDLKVYQPLVEECVRKAFLLGPEASQTGPAKRGDEVTMDKHLDLLRAGGLGHEKVYQMVSQMIQARFDVLSKDH